MGPKQLSPLLRNILYGELYVECAINLITGALQLLSPASTLSPLARAGVDLCPVSLETQRWGGAFTFTFGGLLLLRVLLPFEPRAVKLLLEVLCAGDLVYLASLLPFTIAFGALPLGLAPFLLTAPMFACRLLLRTRENWEAVSAEGVSSGSNSSAALEPLVEGGERA